ncbi:unnamed protein product [Caenorhabditis nigoni]
METGDSSKTDSDADKTAKKRKFDEISKISKQETSGKKFVLKEIYENAVNFMNNKSNFTSDEEHFNVEWYMNVEREDDHLGFYVYCNPCFDDKDEQSKQTNWSILANIDFKVFGIDGDVFMKSMNHCFNDDGGYGFPEFMEWKKVEKENILDGNLTVEAHVTIIETIGLGREKIRSFDESQKDVSDGILKVRNTNFYVSKTFLSAQSSFFKSLFLGKFSESKESIIPLTGIDPLDFHFLLEVLYGESSIDDTNVEGVALLADMYDIPLVIKKCEEFLLEKSEKHMEEKFRIADNCHLENWKKSAKAKLESEKASPKKFILKNVFEIGTDSEIESQGGAYSEKEEHFGCLWYMHLTQEDGDFKFSVNVLNLFSPTKKWSIDTEIEFKTVDLWENKYVESMSHCFENGGSEQFMEVEICRLNYYQGNFLPVEAHVTIKKSIGLERTKIRWFDRFPQKDLSDAILDVCDTKFYVIKMFLAAQSPFFKDLFFGIFSESAKSEVSLTGDDPLDFHSFLEVLYGESAINEFSVEGILHLAIKYDAPTAVRRCEEFLGRFCRKSMKKKLQMATKYDLYHLKKEILNKITKKEDIRSVIPANITDLDHEVMGQLLKKAVGLR